MLGPVPGLRTLCTLLLGVNRTQLCLLRWLQDQLHMPARQCHNYEMLNTPRLGGRLCPHRLTGSGVQQLPQMQRMHASSSNLSI